MTFNEVLETTVKKYNIYRNPKDVLVNRIKDILEGQGYGIYYENKKPKKFTAYEVNKAFKQKGFILSWVYQGTFVEIDLDLKLILSWEGDQLRALKQDLCSKIHYEDNIGLYNFILS